MKSLFHWYLLVVCPCYTVKTKFVVCSGNMKHGFGGRQTQIRGNHKTKQNKQTNKKPSFAYVYNNSNVALASSGISWNIESIVHLFNHLMDSWEMHSLDTPWKCQKIGLHYVRNALFMIQLTLVMWAGSFIIIYLIIYFAFQRYELRGFQILDIP